VFTARYALSPYIKPIGSVFKGLKGMKVGNCSDLKELKLMRCFCRDGNMEYRSPYPEAAYGRVFKSIFKVYLYCFDLSSLFFVWNKRNKSKVRRCWCLLLEARKWAVYQEGNNKLSCRVGQTNERREWLEWSLLGCCIVVDIQVTEGCRTRSVWVVPTHESLFQSNRLTPRWIKAFKWQRKGSEIRHVIVRSHRSPWGQTS
jgi:hypothetical protein